MILVCGSVTDIVTELVCARLEDQRSAYRLLELTRYPEQYKVTWVWEKNRPDGVIEGPGWRVDLASISGVFVRYLARDSRSSLLRDRLRSFYDECKGRVIFKSLSGARSIVRLMEPADFERLPLLRDGAAQFQEHVPGTDVRVHTVGTEVFATRIRSGGVDYRYAEQQGAAVEMEPAELPAWVADACLDLARGMDLIIAGIDLKLTPAGEWYCFEANPCPGFASYELRTGQPISAALVAALGGGRHRGEGRHKPGRQDTVETGVLKASTARSQRTRQTKRR